MESVCQGDCNGPLCEACLLRRARAELAAMAGRAPPAAEPPSPVRRKTCRHLGQATGEEIGCGTCPGSVRIKILACAVFGKCTLAKKLEGIACCQGCAKYEESP
jgi:hypothetical protein